MIELAGDVERLVNHGNEIRDHIFKYLPLILESPHIPKLTDEQKTKVIDKLAYLAKFEYRASFYVCSLLITSDLRPGTPDNPTKLTPLVLKWAGVHKPFQYKEPTQKIGEAKNGRVLKSGKSL